jgi:methylenetetrahydrofolate dehydrogenase (NADP+)/methenyltetrahydrofolate cyclohydrolase
MRIFNGKKIADRILSDLKKKIEQKGLKLKLAVISVGKDPASELFVTNKKKAARKTGIKVVHYRFKEKDREKEIIEKIDKLNADPSINGIIVQLPLPKNFNTEKVVGKINPQKDIDGFQKKTPFSSPLISAILIALKASTGKLKSKKIMALVNSDFFGKALKSSLRKKGININYLKNKKSPKTKSADIVILICGCPNLVKGDMIKKGAVLIDGGITILKDKKVVGDVDKKSVAKKAGFLTPVPGGLGPLTVAFLLKNLYFAKIGRGETSIII